MPSRICAKGDTGLCARVVLVLFPVLQLISSCTAPEPSWHRAHPLQEASFETSVLALVEGLGSEEPETRRHARQRLSRLVKDSPHLSFRLVPQLARLQTDAEVRNALMYVLDEINPFEAKLIIHGTPTIGKTLELSVEIRNISHRDQVLVLPVEGSDVALRYPIYSYGIRHASSTDDQVELLLRELTNAQLALGKGRLSPISVSDFVIVPKGGQIDPFQGRKPSRVISQWIPQEPGPVIISFTCDLAAPELGNYEYPAITQTAFPNPVRQLLERVPRVAVGAQLSVSVSRP